MPDARGTLARAANRGARLASIFVAGAIVGWVASERDLLPSPPAPPTPPLLRAEGVAPEMDDDGRMDDGGLMVYASDPSERFVLLYGHLDAYADGLREGMTLARGQRLGVVGTTGNAPPGVPHLHFGILRTDDVGAWWRGTPVDPYPLLAP